MPLTVAPGNTRFASSTVGPSASISGPTVLEVKRVFPGATVGDRAGDRGCAMNGAMLLQHATGVVEHRERTYGPPAESFAAIAARWSLVLGISVTPAQVALCLIDLKLARLTRDPSHLDSIVDVAGYAACLREVTRA